MILTSHEMLGFMAPELAQEILENLFQNDKELYRATMASVAEARKVRAIFLERKPRAERNAAMISTLSRASMEPVAANLIRGWLMKKHLPMVSQFLDELGVKHEKGVIEDLPEKMEDARIDTAVEKLLSSYPPQVVAIYLQAFYSMNEANWPHLKKTLETDPRLQIAS